jgi:hypothetical protein
LLLCSAGFLAAEDLMLVTVRNSGIWTAVLLLLLVPASSFAATRAAASCDAASVQATINNSASGDTVTIPAGTCAWSTAVTIPSGMQITLQGAGAGVTKIDGTGLGTAVLFVGVANRRVTGFTFVCGWIQIDGEDWRIDHNTFTCNTFQAGVYVAGYRPQASPKGLVDHNAFVNRRVIVYGFPGVSLSDLNGATQWFDPLALGTDEAVYVEDNTFTYTVFGNAMDCQHGGRIVFRHNSVTDTYLEVHSVQGTSRACRKWEIYENTITQSTFDVYRPMFLRGGTGVVFNNTMSGAFGEKALAVDNVRTNTSYGPPFGKCDGTSPWDGNADATGSPCLDQIGRGADSSIFNGTPPPYPVQRSEPAYFWNNNFDGVLAIVSVDNGSATQIRSDRDYVVNKGVKPGYAPYQYPHPLQRLPPPSNVRLIQP